MPLPDTTDNVSSEARAKWLALFPDEVERKGAQPPGGFTSGTSLIGGPLTIDAFGARRAPTPYQLVESYKSVAYACVQLNMNAVTRVPLRMYANTSKGKRASDASGPRSIGRSTFNHLRSMPYIRSFGQDVDNVQEITNHPLIDLIDQPAIVEDDLGEVSYFSRSDFLGLVSIYCDVVGVHYCFPQGPNGRPPKYLWPMFSQYVLPVPASHSAVIGRYQYFAETFEPSQLLRFRSTSMSIRDPYKTGYSATYASLQYLNLEDEFASIQSQLLAAGPRPNMIFSAKDGMMPPGDVERKRFEIDLERKLAKGNAGRHLVTTGAWDVKPVSYAPTDLAGLDLQGYNIKRIANCYGVPVPYLEGDTDAMNLKGADVQHARNTIEPRHRMIAETLTILAQKYDPRLFFAFDPSLPEDEELKAKVIDMKLKNGSITINQANEDTMNPPVEWGDEPWIPGTLVQPSMAVEKHEVGLDTAKAGVENQGKMTELKATEIESKAEEKDESSDEQSRRLDVLIERVASMVENEMKSVKGAA